MIIPFRCFYSFRDHLSEFTSAVAISDATSSTRKRSAISYARVLFEILSKMATAATSDEEEKDDHLAVVEGLPKLYASFLQQNRCSINHCNTLFIDS